MPEIDSYLTRNAKYFPCTTDRECEDSLTKQIMDGKDMRAMAKEEFLYISPQRTLKVEKFFCEEKKYTKETRTSLSNNFALFWEPASDRPFFSDPSTNVVYTL